MESRPAKTDSGRQCDGQRINLISPAQKAASAGQHTFRFSATCDGYKKQTSGTAVVTVRKADVPTSFITAPAAQENLTYTGQEQALVTAGSVKNYGTMQYSLAENVAYIPDIPTATYAGDYTVWYRVAGDANHNDIAPCQRGSPNWEEAAEDHRGGDRPPKS